jgi:GNAT superfamily N-acetyltransferase
MPIRRATPDDASAISTLVQAGFMAHIAPDWEALAVQSFLAETSAEKLAPTISEASFVAVYEEDGQIRGVISLPRPSLLQLLFVAPEHLRRGIGRSLWEDARAHVEEKHPEIKTIELNSSPFAVPAYKALGFFPISEPFRRKGAVATRMACWLPGRALERTSNAA